VSEDQKTWGQIAYEAYCQHQEWKSWTEDPLPAWLNVRPDIKIAWEYAAVCLMEQIKQWKNSQEGDGG
jgi:hypothetical protein